MLSDAMLFEHIKKMPDNMKAEVAELVARLEQKLEPREVIKERQIGGLKGAFIMSPDFDEPMEEFKDYI